MARLSARQGGKQGTVTIDGQLRDVSHEMSVSTGATAYNVSVVFGHPVIINFADANLNTGVAARIKRLPHPVSTVIPFALGTTEALNKLDQFLNSANEFLVEGTAYGLDPDSQSAFRTDCVAIMVLSSQANANFIDVDVIR